MQKRLKFQRHFLAIVQNFPDGFAQLLPLISQAINGKQISIVGNSLGFAKTLNLRKGGLNLCIRRLTSITNRIVFDCDVTDTSWSSASGSVSTLNQAWTTIYDLKFNVCISTPENGGMAGAFIPWHFKRGAEVPLHNSIISNFMIYQDRIETNLLQPFAHPQSSEWFSIISVIIF